MELTSYVISTRDGQKEILRLDLGTATNNEAEYQTLIAALNDLYSRIQRAARSPPAYSLLIYTDSQLVVSQLTQGWKVKAANLRPLVDEAAASMRTFACCDLVKVPRDERNGFDGSAHQPHPRVLAPRGMRILPMHTALPR